MKIRYGGKVYDPAKLRRLGRKFGWWRMGRHRTSTIEYRKNLDGSNKQINHYLLRYVTNPLYIKHAIQYMFGGFYRGVLGIFSYWDGDGDKTLTNALSDYLTIIEDSGLYWVRGAKATAICSFKGWEWESGGNVRPKSTKHRELQRFTAAPCRMMWIRYDGIDNKVDVEFWNEERWEYQLVQTTHEEWENSILPKIELLPSGMFREVGTKI